MADKPDDQITIDEKIAQAKELYSIGTRNYYVKAYSDAADDLSTVCSLYAEIYGPTADELGMPYLLYAKSLVAVGQDENKLVDIPEEDEEDEDESESEQVAEEGKEIVDGDTKEEDSKIEEDEVDKIAEKEQNEIKEDSEIVEESKKHDQEVEKNDSNPTIVEPQPGTSTMNGHTEQTEPTEDEEDDVANLQVAWEVLELAVTIFSRQGEKGLSHLAECYSELAGISFENSHFELAIKDFMKALDILSELPKQNKREFAEIHYKIGLCHIMLNSYEESVVAMKKACDFLDDVIREEEAKESTEEKKNNITDLEETKQEIINKITEVEETKQQSIDEVKKELSKLIGHPSEGSTDGAGPSSSGSSSEADKPKPTDISHLIKRKKTESDGEGSPIKKNNFNISGGSGGDDKPNDISHLVKRKKLENDSENVAEEPSPTTAAF